MGKINKIILHKCPHFDFVREDESETSLAKHTGGAAAKQSRICFLHETISTKKIDRYEESADMCQKCKDEGYGPAFWKTAVCCSLKDLKRRVREAATEYLTFGREYHRTEPRVRYPTQPDFQGAHHAFEVETRPWEQDSFFGPWLLIRQALTEVADITKRAWWSHEDASSAFEALNRARVLAIQVRSTLSSLETAIGFLMKAHRKFISSCEQQIRLVQDSKRKRKAQLAGKLESQVPEPAALPSKAAYEKAVRTLSLRKPEVNETNELSFIAAPSRSGPQRLVKRKFKRDWNAVSGRKYFERSISQRFEKRMEGFEEFFA